MKKVIAVLTIAAFLIPAVSLAALNQNLSYGSSGPGVTDLQNFLTTQGFYTGPITGNFYGLTRSAVIAFQKQNLIQPASGFVGVLTRAVINSILAQSVTASSSPLTNPSAVQNTVVASSTAQNAALAPATQTQLAGIALLCTTANLPANASQYATVVQGCNDGTILSGYDTNATFRSEIDTAIQGLQARIAQQQENCKNIVTPYDPSVSSAANIEMSQVNFAAEEDCLTGTTAATQQLEQQLQLEQTNSELGQLQQAVNANTTALQEQQQEQAGQQAAQQLQQEQQSENQQILNSGSQTNCGPLSGVYGYCSH